MKNTLEHIEAYHAVMDGRSIVIMQEQLDDLIKCDFWYRDLCPEYITEKDKQYTFRLCSAQELLNKAKKRVDDDYENQQVSGEG